MQPADRMRFRAVMMGMAELYQRDCSGPLLDAYWVALADWSLADLEAAAVHLMATATFMPRPADFNALRKSGRETAGEAWVRVVRESPRWRHGQRGDQDPLVDACIQAIGGNERIALADFGQLHWLQKTFMETYVELREVHVIRKTVPQITGHTTGTNLISTAGQAVALPEAADR